ncbi:MAG: HAMP domain-containing sensor histidine kinase [Clostridia bacterium]|nr:HAMP domain-containing sensor histidine kinase [Clostridia bacterium]
MIKKLRRRFILMTMGIVTLVLLAIFLVVFISIQGVMKKNTKSALQFALLTSVEPQQKTDETLTDITVPQEGSPLERDGHSDRGEGIPAYLFDITDEDEPVLIKGDPEVLEREDAGELVDMAIGEGTQEGKLEDKSLMFSIRGDYIAFVDTAATDKVMSSVVMIGILVFAATLLLFFVLSIFLSKWAVRPTERAWKQQKRFVADASHDLKTPLTIILSNADIAMQQDGAEDGHMSMIREEAIRMKQLIEQMLQMARLDAIETKLKAERVDLSAAIEGGLLPFDALLFEHGVTLTSEIEPNLFVMGNEDELRRMLEALMDNACKYTPEGESVIVSVKANAKKKAVLEVRNTGVCLTSEQLNHIFDRFYRAEDSRTTLSSYGLGLSIAQAIAHRHKSEIKVASNAEIGVSFTIELPLHTDP